MLFSGDVSLCLADIRGSRAHPRGCSTTTLTTNIAIFILTFWRYFRLPESFTRQGIGRIVIRDSGLTLAAITGEEPFSF